jgi:hypothetical protein
MTPEEEAPSRQPSAPGRKKRREPRRDDRAPEPGGPVEAASPSEPGEGAAEPIEEADPADDEEATDQPVHHHHVSGLLEELVGREIATRLRARYSEISARIHEQPVAAAQRDAWMTRADRLNPDLWLTPDSILEGVRSADRLFDELRSELRPHSSRE